MRKKRGKRTESAFLIRFFLRKLNKKSTRIHKQERERKKTRFVEGVRKQIVAYFSIGNVKKECMEGR